MAVEPTRDRDIRIEDEMRTSYLSYSMSAIKRATPDVRDGLKPVHRRVLYGMLELGLRHSSGYRKSAKVVGEVMGRFHPHGDMAIYDTVVRLAQPFSMRYPLVDGQGNFGSVDGDSPAASRYTEVRLTAIAEELLADIDQDTVDFQDNYDATEREPSVLPTRVPNYLVNGNMGIAVGMATSVPPHNLVEVCDALAFMIDHPDVTVDDLLKIVKGPDFPTGALILGRDGIQQAYATGHGRIVQRAVCEIEQMRGGRNAIIVRELPYQVNKALMLERTAELVKAKKIDGITEIRDESDRDGMRAVFELRRDAQPRKVLNALYKHTALQSNFSVNMLAIVDGEPRVLTLKRCLQEFLAFRQTVITRRTRYQLRKAQERAHILEGLTRALDMLDEVIACIRRSQTGDSAVHNLMHDFKFSEAQARAIGDLALRRLASLERKKIIDEYKALLKTIEELQGILADIRKVLDIIKKEMLELKEKYGDARRTRIVDETGELSEEDLIPHQQVLVTLTTQGYIKRSPADGFQSHHRGSRGKLGMLTRTEDAVQHSFVADALDSVMFFTNRGRVFTLKVHELPDVSRQAKGLPIINLVALEPRETINAMLGITSFEGPEQRFLLMATRQGTVKKTALTDYANVRRNGLIAISLNEGDDLAWVRPTDGTQEVVLVTRQGRAICFAETQIRPTGRDTAGVKGITLGKDDTVMSMAVVPSSGAVAHTSDLLVITSLGYGKRTSMEEYRKQTRGGQGVTTAKLGEKTGTIVAGHIVNEDDAELMLTTANGIVNRLPLAQVRQSGRNTQGVMLIRLGANDSVAAATVIGKNGEEVSVQESVP
jgi:DNA gyrase subunit A